MRKYILLILINISLVFAQERCGSSLFMNKNINEENVNLLLRKKIENKIKNWKYNYSSSINIPVVFHVIYKNTNENISDAQIISQLNILNEDFRRQNSDTINTPNDFLQFAADTEINFCLAKRTPENDTTSGITRTLTSVNSFSLNDNNIFFDSLGGKSIWNTKKYLNIYICDLTGVLGFASFPGTNQLIDGVVIDFEYFGNTGTALSPYNKGRTCTHEVGHWLNLMHIWGDITCGDDFVSDTPEQEIENYSCPQHPSPSCSNNGDMFQNYMDYTNDACMNLFTIGQKNRMHATLNLSREDIINSKACYFPYEDISITSNLSSFCSTENLTSTEISVNVENLSSKQINSFKISYILNNNNPVTLDWTGNLNSFDNVDLTIGNEQLIQGQHTLKIFSSNPNGFNDLNNLNDTIHINFEIFFGENYDISILTDNYGEEVSWEITNDSNQIINFGDSLISNQFNSINLCLHPDSCYMFTIYDSYNDGICCDFGNGFFSINQINYSGEFGSSFSVDLCNLSELNDSYKKLYVYPNPSTGKFVFLFPDIIYNFDVFDINGNKILSKNFSKKEIILDLSGYRSGLYIVRANNNKNNYVYKITKY